MSRKTSKQLFNMKVHQFLKATKTFTARLQDLHRSLKPQNTQIIIQEISKASSSIAKTKWLIFLNYLIMQKTITNQQTSQNLINAISCSYDPSSSMEKMLSEKLIIPYKLYLQKRNMFNYLNNQNELYQIVNLIRSALSFTDVVFILGRYFFKQHPFLIQFQFAICKDLASLYRRMKANINQEKLFQLAEVLEKMNEGMYNVYYNCYFSQFTARLAPNWINTETIFNKMDKKNQKGTEGKKSNEAQQTIFEESDLELNSGKTFFELDSMCQQFKSTSTIQSNDKDDKRPEQSQICSRRQFISLARNLLQKMDEIQSQRNSIY